MLQTGEENRELKKKLYKCNVCAVECYDEEVWAVNLANIFRAICNTDAAGVF